MPEHATSQQGSFEIDPDLGAFVVPDAPNGDEYKGKFDADVAEQARLAYLASRSDSDYNPNQHRAEQTQGAGGGISEAANGNLTDLSSEDSRTSRVLRVGSYFDGKPIMNDTQLQWAIETQRARDVVAQQRNARQLNDIARERAQRGITEARKAIPALPEEEAPVLRPGIDADFDSTIFAQEIPEGREIPNQPTQPPRRTAPIQENRTIPYIPPKAPQPKLSPANVARRALYRGTRPPQP